MSDDIEAVVKREVDAARKILREDKLITSHAALRDKLNKHFPDEETETDNDGKPKPPAKKTEPEPGSGGKKPGLWWGAVPGDE